jgi:hypothetical protein
MKELFLIATGAVIGGAVGLFWGVVDHQTAWQEGRESILNSTVTVGGDDTPCSVTIPLSVLAEMVNVGVMDWHRACKGESHE